VDTAAGDAATGWRIRDLLHKAKQFDAAAEIKDEDVVLDAGGTRISLVRWETNDPDTPGVPTRQTLERLVCAAMAAAYPQRGPSVHNWLGSRPDPPRPSSKEPAWSYMAGWYAELGC
jgi:hypothetical protein